MGWCEPAPPHKQSMKGGVLGLVEVRVYSHLKA